MNNRWNMLVPIAAAVLLFSACAGPTDPKPGDPKPGGPDWPVSAIAVGNSFSMALSGGVVYTWGHNTSGQLGTGAPTSQNASSPVAVSGLPAGVTQIAAGAGHALALDPDGDVWAWGHNNRGQIGLGWPTPGGAQQQYTEPVRVDLEDMTQIAAQGETSYALDSTGALFAWGNNSHFELGDGTNQSYGEPRPVGFPEGTTIAAVFAGRGHVHALDSEGNVWYWGDAGLRLGDGSGDPTPIPVRAADLSAFDLLAPSAFSGSGTHVLALGADDMLYGWGSNSNFELALADDTGSAATPTLIPDMPDPVNAFAAGGGFSVAASAGEVYSWGTAYFGELGNGSLTGSSPEPQKLSGLEDVVALAAAAPFSTGYGRHVLALTGDGRLYSWGYNRYGQLGTGGTADSGTPTRVTLP